MRYNSNCACSSVELECNPPKVEVTRLNRVKRTKLRKIVLLIQDFFFIDIINKKQTLKIMVKNYALLIVNIHVNLSRF